MLFFSQKLWHYIIAIYLVVSMQSDEKIQSTGIQYVATIASGKLLLEINDRITYKGELEIPPYCDIMEVKVAFQRGEVQVLAKTTSKIVIKLGFYKIELLSEDSHEIKALKAKIAELEKKLESQWEDEELDSKENFDLNCYYKIITGGWSCLSSAVSSASIYVYVGSGYTISSSNRRACSSGWTVTKIQKRRN